jgi:hypothetical protein
VRWLLLAPLVILLNVCLIVALVTRANPFAGSPSTVERLVVFGNRVAELPPFAGEAQLWRALRGGGDPGPAERCRTVLVARWVVRTALVLGEDGQLRVEDRRVRLAHRVTRCR